MALLFSGDPLSLSLSLSLLGHIPRDPPVTNLRFFDGLL
jgi:hypothetical protein